MPLSSQGLIRGLVARALINVARNVDSQNNDVAYRLGAFGEQWALALLSDLKAQAEEGSYYVASSATTANAPGTGVTSSPATGTAFADATGVLTIVNTDAAKRIYLDFILEIITIVPTGSTSKQVIHAVDRVNRYTSGGVQLFGQSVTTDGSPATDAAAQINVIGAGVIAAAGPKRAFIGRDIVRTVIPVVNDHYLWKFGNQEAVRAEGWPASVATVQKQQFQQPPVILAPGGSYVMNELSPARSVAESAEWFIGYAVR